MLKPIEVPPSGQIVIVFDRFTHRIGFFSWSYDCLVSWVTVYNGGQNTFSYSVPTYTSPVSGESFKLTDVLDYRPLVQDDTVSTTQNGVNMRLEFNDQDSRF